MEAHRGKTPTATQIYQDLFVFSFKNICFKGFESSHRLVFGPNCREPSTLCFCPHGQVVRLHWPTDLLPAFPSSSDHGLKRSSPQLEVD